MTSYLAIAALMIWIPLIPLRLLIQGGIDLWKKMGDLSYLIFFLYWALIDLFLLVHYERLLSYQFQTYPVATVIGTGLILLALVLAYWTAKTLGLVTLSTRPQVSPQKATASLIVTGPYCYLRHPFYFAEWLLLLGLTLVTRSWIILGLTLISVIVDPIVTLFEERELIQRFGSAYREYQKKVPRLLPTLSKGVS